MFSSLLRHPAWKHRGAIVKGNDKGKVNTKGKY